jgi:hypothetical protein
MGEEVISRRAAEALSRREESGSELIGTAAGVQPWGMSRNCQRAHPGDCGREFAFNLKYFFIVLYRLFVHFVGVYRPFGSSFIVPDCHGWSFFAMDCLGSPLDGRMGNRWKRFGALGLVGGTQLKPGC